MDTYTLDSIHESAHAVLGEWAGKRVQLVSLAPKGEVVFERVEEPNLSALSSEWFEREMRVALAGAAGEFIACGYRGTVPKSKRDLACAQALVELHQYKLLAERKKHETGGRNRLHRGKRTKPPKRTQPKPLSVERAYSGALLLLGLRWGEVETLARALREALIFTGEQARSILETAPQAERLPKQPETLRHILTEAEGGPGLGFIPAMRARLDEADASMMLAAVVGLERAAGPMMERKRAECLAGVEAIIRRSRVRRSPMPLAH